MQIISLENKKIFEDYNQFAVDVLIGLSKHPKRLSPKYFYDDAGSDLFQKITSSEDYYLTRIEFSILDKISSLLPKNVSEKEIDIIELGAGDGHKSKLILDGFIEAGVKVNYCPIDISSQAMELLAENISETENLKIKAVVSEYMAGLKYLRKTSTNKQLVLFLGSNIGNFDKDHSIDFLRQIWNCLNHGDFLLSGFDLKKILR